MPKITFSNRNNEFYQSLKTAVDEYFEKKQVKKTGDWRLYSKTIILIGAAITGYCFLMFTTLSALPALLIAAGLGYVFACIGFSVMHDANHGSYSTKPWLNDMLGLSANALGASSFFWKQKHNIIHHTYTNVDGNDDDIAKSPSFANANRKNGYLRIKCNIYI
ncbi:MAG: fatty acid desaturase [Ferruginibacter sp.]